MFEPPQYVFVSIFLYPLCRCLYIFVTLYDTYYIEHVSVRNNENQASQVFVLTYLDGFADICRTRGFSWDFLLQGCLWNLLPQRVVRENFGNRNFNKAVAPRSVWGATRGARNCGKLAGNVWDMTYSHKEYWRNKMERATDPPSAIRPRRFCKLPRDGGPTVCELCAIRVFAVRNNDSRDVRWKALGCAWWAPQWQAAQNGCYTLTTTLQEFLRRTWITTQSCPQPAI